MDYRYQPPDDVVNRPLAKMDRQSRLIVIALRIVFLIVGPLPPLMAALFTCAGVELTVELIAWDFDYFQDHKWCPLLATLLAGTVCFAMRRLPFFEAGLWIGPGISLLGVYTFLQR